MTLSILWFILIAVLWTGYLVLEGFDFGVGMLIKTFPKNEAERRVMYNAIGPHWDGNEVWLLTAGGATFAAFPEWYATMFSGFYLALFLILVCLIVRVCAIEWRAKIQGLAWRSRWDTIHTGASWVVSILWGVAFANLIQGMAIEVVDRSGDVVAPADVASSLADASHQLTGGFFSLLSPYTILGGLVTTSIFLTLGALFTAMKSTDDLHVRAGALAKTSSIVATVLAAVWVLWGQLAYSANAIGWLPLVVAALALVACVVLTRVDRVAAAFGAGVVAVAGAVAWIFVTAFPNVMKSSIDPAYSLTIDQASSSQYTLTVMSFVALGLVPVVLVYQGYTYWVFRKRLSAKHVPDQPAGLPLEYETAQTH